MWKPATFQQHSGMTSYLPIAADRDVYAGPVVDRVLEVTAVLVSYLLEGYRS